MKGFFSIIISLSSHTVEIQLLALNIELHFLKGKDFRGVNSFDVTNGVGVATSLKRVTANTIEEDEQSQGKIIEIIFHKLEEGS